MVFIDSKKLASKRRILKLVFKALLMVSQLSRRLIGIMEEVKLLKVLIILKEERLLLLVRLHTTLLKATSKKPTDILNRFSSILPLLPNLTVSDQPWLVPFPISWVLSV